MLELRPILSALWRHKVSALLIALQLGLTLAIVSNALVVIDERSERISRPTGLAVEDINSFSFLAIPEDYDKFEAFRLDLDMIRSLPGVASATISNHVPLSGSGSASGFYTEPNKETGGISANYYTVDEHFIDALGMKLTAGRGFSPEEVMQVGATSSERPTVAVVTQKFADEVFPEGNALGKAFFLGGDDHPIEVVGIVERNLGPWPNSSVAGRGVFYPAIMDQWFYYIVRAEPGQRDAVLKLVEEKLAERDPNRVINADTMEEQKAQQYASDNTMIKVLASVVILLTFIVALGIVGLTVFWITQRQKQIGVRRALGATRSAISRYFLLENLIIAVTGIALGAAAAQVFNGFLASEFNQPALPPIVTISCALFLLGVSLAAALVPALRAANISPATATRSV
ncbi:ABC transporter permease [Microbulbifer flavimaris]|uniref:ABC transporter permease n=1 Tax=Microbulbifer flavimaris TaxID=1781068 RepID=A0ABX4HZJ2_9GAMM|nr:MULTISPECIES: FtsX-like permease family protein [Microbulbifer]KUJ83388.1 ABC transporter permease [Microbulbifer sp. ZGT114]PCO05544.1 ABC transporter permease [Microbulbifer flavimaris]